MSLDIYFFLQNDSYENLDKFSLIGLSYMHRQYLLKVKEYSG